LDNRAPYPAIFKDYAAGTSSEQSRGLWWYVHNAAHLKTEAGWGCKRQSFFGHQIMFLKSGHGGCTYQGQTCRAGPGQAVFMNLHHPHDYWTDADDPWEMHYVRFDGPGVPQIYAALMATARSPVMTYASIPAMEQHFTQLYQLLKQQPPGFDAWVWHHLTGLIALIVEGLRSGSTSSLELGQTNQGVAAAMNFLRGHHQESITVDDLARAAHMSRYHFTRRFKQATGFTPMEYLEKHRIGRAKELMLTEPNLRLSEIAHAVGYDDPAYFSRVFRKREGISSKAYRKLTMQQQGD